MNNNLKQYSTAELNELKASLEMVTKREFVENDLKTIEEELVRRAEVAKAEAAKKLNANGIKSTPGIKAKDKPLTDYVGKSYKQTFEDQTSYYHIYGVLRGKFLVEVVRTTKDGITRIYTAERTPAQFFHPEGKVKADLQEIPYSDYQKAHEAVRLQMARLQKAIEQEMKDFYRGMYRWPFGISPLALLAL